MKVILDCDLMKYPHSGLYHYCLNLGTYVRQIMDPGKEKMAFFVPRAEKNSFGPDAEIIIERKNFWNHLNPALRNYTIWHAPFQSGRIWPRKKYPGVKILLTIHDLNPIHEGKPLEEQRNSLAHTQSLIDRSDALVCISEFCRQDVLKNCNVGRKPIYVIHNGTHKVHEPALQLNSYKPARPFLFGMGYVNTKKNYHVLLPLLKDAQYELLIAGRLDEPDYIERMKKRAAAMGVADRLHIVGPVTEGEKAWYFNNCCAFVHPSLAEGFGAPVVEAMQFGKPLFLSSLTSLPEIAGDAAYYFRNFESDHMQEVFACGMKEYGLNGMAMKIMKRGREFDWKQKAQQYLELYRSLA